MQFPKSLRRRSCGDPRRGIQSAQRHLRGAAGIGVLIGVLVPPPFFLIVNNFGNPNLKPQSINAYEVAYTGRVDQKTALGLAVYQNDQTTDISFTNLLTIPPEIALANGLTFYSATNPARGITLDGQPITVDPFIMGALPAPFNRLPRNVATYLNFGPLRQRGVEFWVDRQFTNEMSSYANYSYQTTPKVLDADPDQIRYPLTTINIPPKHRFNAGITFSGSRLLASVSLNHTSSSYSHDVLAPAYAGVTGAFTMVNASLGLKWGDGKAVTSLKGTNIFNQTIQQEIYGDILRFGLVAEARIFLK